MGRKQFNKQFPQARWRGGVSLQWTVHYLKEQSSLDLAALYGRFHTSENGLTESAAFRSRERWGYNEPISETHPRWWRFLLRPLLNPFTLLLGSLGVISLLTGDWVAAGILSMMILVSLLLRFFQEYRAALSIERLTEKVTTSATVLRRDDEGVMRQREIPMRELVPGDIVSLSAGDMIPADLRLITCKDLFVSQQILTGESLPSEKTDAQLCFPEEQSFHRNPTEPMADLRNICFMATNVVSGTGMGVALSTGRQTFFGSVAQFATRKRAATAFDHGIQNVSWLFVRFILVLIPLVLFLNGFTKGDWSQAFFFAIAVGVGLTPEMLPMIVSANLARGAVNLSKEKVIVKHLHSVQNLGAIDILCTDKTGTLTQDQIVLERHFDLQGRENPKVWWLAYLNSFYQTGLKNLFDKAILNHSLNHIPKFESPDSGYVKVDEIPFDFSRRRMSVIVEDKEGSHLLITKGASEEILTLCGHVLMGEEALPLEETQRRQAERIKDTMSGDGLRILGVAFRRFSPGGKRTYSAADETDMVLAGFIAFLDPPKTSAKQAITGLKGHGVKIKILTGDNEMVARKICDWLDVEIGSSMNGAEIDLLMDADLGKAVERVNLFAKLTPTHKARIIRALQSNDHVVGFIGDGINDAPALRDADVGISVDSAADIAKESADIVLTDKDLTVLERAIVEGRTAFGNTVKFIKTAASSNLGNVLTVVAASSFLPFLPMLPLQFLVQNLIYDFSQTMIPFDQVDDDFISRPRRWNSGGIGRFMLVFGPLSSVFDFMMFAVLWYFFGANSLKTAALFQTGWFVHGLVTQTVIVLILRTGRIPFLQSWPSPALLWSTLLAVTLGVLLPYLVFGSQLHMVPLPSIYFAWLAVIVGAYCGVTQWMKLWYLGKYREWL